MEDTESVDPSTPPAPEIEAPTPAPTAELVPDAAALADFADRGATQRLPAAEEEKAARLVQAGLLAGKEDLAAVAAALPKLGWAVAVKGVTAAWPELKATSKNSLLKTLAADESEAGRRIRLSIARGLFKVPDVATCVKLVLGVCKDIRDKETGQLSSRDAQHFANVMIGKGKPWIAQLPLTDLKPAEVSLLVHCAVIAAFSVNGPPVTPLGVLKWAAEAGQLGELHEIALAAVTRGVARWSPKWADALRKEVPNVPEPILAALKAPGGEAAAAPSSDAPAELERGDSDRSAELHSPTAPMPDEDQGLPAELREAPSTSAVESPGAGEEETYRPRERPVYISKTIPQKEGRPPQQPGQSQAPQREMQPREGGPREARGPGAKSPQFNAAEVLRQVESHISWLKNELQVSEKKLRARDDDRRQRRAKPDVPVIEGEPTPDELARLNVQLESRITELQGRIDDLTADAEARATSAGAFADGPAPEPDAQLRTLLGLKLRECHADFVALEQQDRDLVIPQHYRTVLAEVFEVLKTEKVPLDPES